MRHHGHVQAGDDPRFSAAWREFRRATDLDEYDERWDRLAAQGHAVHGEADFVHRLGPASVLDAGCGAGRVAIELARRGVSVVGVDLDADLLARARRRAPELAWIHADLADLDAATLAANGVATTAFDVVVMAGNVLPFVDPSRRRDVVARLAGLVVPGGRLVTGAGIGPAGPTTDELDAWAAAAGLELEARFAGWDRERWQPGGGYAVSVHRRPAP